MIHTDKDALECDLAETYQIYDMYGLPCTKVALFSCGLREDSRIKMKLNNQKLSYRDYLLTAIYDKLSYILWIQTDDARRGINRPESILAKIDGDESHKNSDIVVFDSVEDFDRELERLKKEAEINE